MRRLVILLCVPLALAGCGSSGADKGGDLAFSAPATPMPSTTAQVAAPTTAAPKPTKHVVTNAEVCDQVHTYIYDHIRATFKRWDTRNNLFDQKISRQLRAEATHMYSLAAKAKGTTSSSIRGEARGLTRLSIAIESNNVAGVGSASDSANASLADLRGTCSF